MENRVAYALLASIIRGGLAYEASMARLGVYCA